MAATAPDPPPHAAQPLADLAPGRRARVVSVLGDGPVAARLRDLGWVAGTPVTVIRRAPLGDPTLYAVRGCTIALRQAEARRILVSPAEDDAG